MNNYKQVPTLQPLENPHQGFVSTQPSSHTADNLNMPRTIRYHPPGALVHMISNFAFAAPVLALPNARNKYLALAERAVRRTDWIAIAYALMDTHPHWALIAGHHPASNFYHPLNTGFGLWVNQQRRQSMEQSNRRFVGRVFAQRPATFSVAPQDGLQLIAYLHNNPVHAGLVGDASQSDWTSHRAYLNPRERPHWLSVSRALEYCGYSDTEIDRRAFHEQVASLASAETDWVPADTDTLRARRQLRRDMNAPVDIATPFVRVEPIEWIFPTVNELPLPIQARWRGDIVTFLNQVAITTRISQQRLRSRNREREVCHARRIAVHAWVDSMGRPLKEIAKALGISSAAASRYLRNSRRDPICSHQAQGVAARCRAKDPCDTSELEQSLGPNKLTS